MGRTLERLSVFIRGRLPQGKSPEQDRHARAADLIAQLPSEDNITSTRLMRSIRRLSPDQDLGFKAIDAWDALSEARAAQEREPDQDYSELISQAQLQHGYAFSREIDADIARTKRNKLIKDVALACTIVVPVVEGVIALGQEIKRQIVEADNVNRAFRAAEIEARWNARENAQEEIYRKEHPEMPEFMVRELFGPKTDRNPRQ